MTTRRRTAPFALVASLFVVSGCSLLLPTPEPDRFTTLSPARWELDPAELPVPADTSFEAIVTEIGCASGRQIDDKLLPPVVEYGVDEIVVRLYLEPPPGEAHECPGNPPTRFSIPLREPIGNRTLVDGSLRDAQG